MNPKEEFQNLVNISKERIKNPFIGSFILAWITVNFSVPYLLITSEYDVLATIEIIHAQATWEKYLFWPLGIAAFYTFIMPHFSNLVVFLTAGAKKRKRKLSNTDTVDELEGQKDVVQLEREIMEIRSGTKEMAQLKAENEGFQGELEYSREIILRQKNELERVKNVIDKVNLSEPRVWTLNYWESAFYDLYAKVDIKAFITIAALITSRKKGEEIHVPKEVRARFSLLGLINDEAEASDITFTEKGSFFYSRLTLEATQDDLKNFPTLGKRRNDIIGDLLFYQDEMGLPLEVQIYAPGSLNFYRDPEAIMATSPEEFASRSQKSSQDKE